MAAPPAPKEREVPKPELTEELASAGPRHLILWNDDVSPVTLVIRMLVQVLGYTRSRAVAKTLAVERLGKDIIFTGSLELCELRHEQFSAVKLTTTIEPA
jgi:ATP-dependent Clp protease adapter protein ClpS